MAEKREILERGPPLTTAHFYRVRPLFQITAINVVGSVAANVPSSVYMETRPASVFLTNSKINGRLDELNIPGKVISQLKHYTAPVYHSIFSWATEIFRIYDLRAQLALNPFVASHGGYRWKWCGVIDRVAMAKLMISDEQLSLTVRFRIACQYCFYDELVMLWNQLTVDERQSLTEFTGYCDRYYTFVQYWCCVLNNDIDSLLRNSPEHQDEIELGLSVANIFAAVSPVRYFWDRLGSESKCGKLVRFASDAFEYCSNATLHKVKDYTDIVPFYVSQMNAEEQLQLLCQHESPYLEQLLRWPYQDLFISAFETAFSTTRDYSSLFISAINVLGDGYACEVTYDNILTVWYKLTDSFQSTVLFDPLFEYLSDLFAVQARPCLDVMLAGVSDEKREEMALSEGCIDECCFMIEVQHNWDGVAELVRYLLPKNRAKLSLFVSMTLSSVRERRMLRSDSNPVSNVSRISYESIEEKLNEIANCYL